MNPKPTITTENPLKSTVLQATGTVSPFIARPGDRKRLVWDLFGLLFIAYDCIAPRFKALGTAGDVGVTKDNSHDGNSNSHDIYES